MDNPFDRPVSKSTDELTDAEMNVIYRFVNDNIPNWDVIDNMMSDSLFATAWESYDELEVTKSRDIDLILTWLTATLPIKSHLNLREAVYTLLETPRNQHLLNGLK